MGLHGTAGLPCRRREEGTVEQQRFAFVGRVSTEDNQEPQASRVRQLAQARRILPPDAEVVEEFFDIGVSRSLPWARRPETSRLIATLKAGTNRWDAIVVGEFARAFGAPIQYSSIYPLIQHFGVELWLPEIGGRVDFTSATTEMLLGRLGGTSKQERALVRARVRDGMTVLAQEGGRHLGGRPPYGYRLADAGPHPNPKKRALGQRLHRLEPDPVTGPVVGRIFDLFAAGLGTKAIATTLTAEGIPSPSAHDPERNRHRDPRGWAHTAIRTILRNEKYLGRAVWGKQRKVDELLDVDDVAAGYVTRQRWADGETWVYGPSDAHPPLVTQAQWEAAAARIAATSPRSRSGPRSPRTTTTPYLLRGILLCGICDRKMQGNKAHGTLRYRCTVTQTRALPGHPSHHPKALYVREDVVVRALDAWLPTLVDADLLAGAQEPDRATTARQQDLRRRVAAIDQATRNLVAALEAGTDPMAVQPRLAELRAEREVASRELTDTAADEVLGADDIQRILDELGGLEHVLRTAEPGEKALVYASLGLTLRYQPDQNRVVATADLGRVLSGVGGGT